MFRFANPIFFILFLIIPFMIWFYLRRQRESGTLKFSNLSLVKNLGKPISLFFRHIPVFLRILVLSLLILGLARPQTGTTTQEVETEGIDIVLALDISSSMKALDFKPKNRLYVAKQAASDFIENRYSDRIGLVVFAKYSFTQCPLTLDYSILKDLLSEVDIGMVEDGTAIGMAIATSVNRLKDSEAKSKVIILLTDGQNNAGKIDPITAAKLANTYDIKIYTIGAGKKGRVPYPARDFFGRETVTYYEIPVDDELLTRVAETTDGMYFRATNKEELKTIYEQIDEMEKTKIETSSYTEYDELNIYFLLPALILFMVELILANTKFRKLP